MVISLTFSTIYRLMSNVIDKETSAPLGDGKVTVVLEKHGRKIGLVTTFDINVLDFLIEIGIFCTKNYLIVDGSG